MWRDHLIILMIFVALAIPVYAVDFWLLKADRWSAVFDLNGLLISLYLAALAVHILLSSAGHHFFKSVGMAALHSVSLILSVAAVALSLFVFDNASQYGRNADAQVAQENRLKLKGVVTLKKWQYNPKPTASR